MWGMDNIGTHDKMWVLLLSFLLIIENNQQTALAINMGKVSLLQSYNHTYMYASKNIIFPTFSTPSLFIQMESTSFVIMIYYRCRTFASKDLRKKTELNEAENSGNISMKFCQQGISKRTATQNKITSICTFL